MVDTDDIHILPGHLEDLIIDEFVVPLIKTAAEEKVVGVVLAKRSRHLLQIRFQAIGDKGTLVFSGRIRERRPDFIFTSIQPLLRLDMVDMGGRELLQATLERILLPRNLIINEIADAIRVRGISCGAFERILNRGVELGVKNEGKILRITFPTIGSIVPGFLYIAILSIIMILDLRFVTSL